VRPIVVQLSGGLGNQLFQYAMGRALSLQRSQRLCLDTRTGFHVDRRYCRSYELEAFSLPDEVKRLVPTQAGILWNRIRHHAAGRGVPVPGYVLETDLKHGQVPSGHPGRILGYWQSEAWFKGRENVIKKDLSFEGEMPPDVKEWADGIGSQPSLAVHARRVDYARKLGIEYYNHAISKMTQHEPGLKIFYFSDDPDWCEASLQHIHGGTVVRHGQEGAIHDFRLMTRCDHFIIPNSTFSWWAAWLGEKEHSKIMLPSKEIWDHEDIVPERWETVQVNSSGEVIL
jgi:hypothetical protein